LPQAGRAAESAAVESPRATVTLISDADAVAPGQSFRVGLRQRLAPRWHTYWKNPGDSGTPPEIELGLPEGATAGEIAWPGPDRLPYGPLVNFGYEDEVVFPIAVTVPESAMPGQTFSVTAAASWLVCEELCIPEEGSFKLDLPVSGTPAPAGGAVAAAFAASDARMPAESPWQARLAVEGAALALTVEGEALSPASVEEAFFFPADWGVVEHAAPQALSVEPGRLRLAMTKGQAFDSVAPVAGLLALTDGGGETRWFETVPSVGAASAASEGGGALGAIAARAEQLSLWQTALFAFLGGLILNLMPCVFPVLAVKATSVAGLSGGALREVRLSGLYYTLGVLVTFVALAGALLAVRAGGGAVGWGFQFQSPLFVAAMSWLLLAVGLNLSGVYEVGLMATRAGQGLAGKRGHLGSFLTGLLAVVVATPCTAPFMGVALGTALAASPAVAIALFLAMGLGLAAPYALLGVFPHLARLLPRPGLWMVRLRQLLAFPMYASAGWLVWVLAQQAGDRGVMIALAGGLLVALAAWLYGIAQHGAGRRLVTRGLALAALAAMFALLPQLSGVAAPDATQSTAAAGAERFSNARLAALREEGKPVFVNMTAAWCLTCLVNERTTLATDTVQDAFRANGVVYLKGDWTNYDPEITAYLRGFEREGVPFYAFYPAGGRDPVVLPAVLTEAAVLDQLQRAVAAN